jgi:class 3 adenylate cyclase
MSSQATSDPEFQIGHVLFIDIVGYSKLLIGEQSELVRQLKEIIAASQQVRLAEEQGKLVSLPTGDGVALVFRGNAEAPAHCALEIAQAVKSRPKLQLRMGIHSGPVNLVTDVNNRTNVAGAGINIAQRVMDCGDAGHILVSKHVAEDLEHYARWQPHLHDFGEYEVKHGLRLVLVNLYTQELGNPQIPARLTTLKKDAISFEKPIASILGRIPWRLVIPSLGIICALAAAIFIIPPFLATRGWHETKARGPSYSKTSYENAKWSKIYGADRLFPARATFQKVAGWNRKNVAITGTIDAQQLLLLLQNSEWKVSRLEGAGGISAHRFVNEKGLIFLRAASRGMADLMSWEGAAYQRLASVPVASSLYILAPDVFCGMDGRGGYCKYSGNALQQFEKTARESFVLRDDNAVAQIKSANRARDVPMPVANVRDVTALGNGKALGLWGAATGECAAVRYREGLWYLAEEIAGLSPNNVPDKAWFIDEKNFVAIGSDKVLRSVNGKVDFQAVLVAGQEYQARELVAVWGRDLNSYWTTDLRGNVFHFDGTRWTQIVRGPDFKPRQKFEAVWPVPNGSVVAITKDEVYALE